MSKSKILFVKKELLQKMIKMNKTIFEFSRIRVTMRC